MSRFILFAMLVLGLAACQPDNPPPNPTFPLVDTTLNNLSYGSDPAQKFNLGLPANRTNQTPLVLVVHGGGWVTGDKTELQFLLTGLKQRGYAVANINYRLTTNNPDNYKMQLDDLDSAIQYCFRQSSYYTFSNQKVYLVGHSAGGHLSLAMSYTRNASGKIKAVASLAGPTDLYSLAYYNNVVYGTVLSTYLGMPLLPVTTVSEQRYKSCSPQYQATASSPATIFFHGELDPIVNPDQSSFLFSRLGTLGVDKRLVSYPLTFHDWWTDNAKVNNTLDELKNWYQAHP
ncbi:MAG: alpha/beta fold hydrolase [Bacteroidota bacterium]